MCVSVWRVCIYFSSNNKQKKRQRKPGARERRHAQGDTASQSAFPPRGVEWLAWPPGSASSPFVSLVAPGSLSNLKLHGFFRGNVCEAREMLDAHFHGHGERSPWHFARLPFQGTRPPGPGAAPADVHQPLQMSRGAPWSCDPRAPWEAQ